MDASKLSQNFRKTLSNSTDLNFFDKFILPHSELIFDSAFRLSKTEVAGQELAQKTFLKAIENPEQFKDASINQKLFSILKTLCLEDTTDSRLEGKAKYDYFNEEKRKEFEKRIPEGLDKLDNIFKKPIEMFYMDGLSLQQISEALNVPIGTIISRIARGKVILSGILSID